MADRSSSLPAECKIDLDEKLAQKGVIFTDLKTAEQKHPELLARMIGKTVNVEEGKFSALAGAFAQNGVVLYVPKGVTVDEPLHSVLWGPGTDLAHVSHILVLVDEGASVTYVHEAASPELKGSQLDARRDRGDPGDAECLDEVRRTAIVGTSRLEFLP